MQTPAWLLQLEGPSPFLNPSNFRSFKKRNCNVSCNINRETQSHLDAGTGMLGFWGFTEQDISFNRVQVWHLFLPDNNIINSSNSS